MATPSTIDDVVSIGPLGIGPVAAVCIQPKYLQGVFLPDGSNAIKVLNYTDPVTGQKPNQQVMAPDVSFDFPAPEYYTSRMFVK